MVGAAMFSLNGVWEILQPSLSVPDQGEVIDPVHFRIQLLIFIFICMPGFFAGHLGYYLTGAVGKSWIGKSILVLSGIGAVLYVIGALYGVVTLFRPLPFRLGIAITVVLCPFLLGVTALIVRTVPLWKRIWPIMMTAAPSILFPVFAANGWPTYGPLTINGMFWLVFGYAVYSEGSKRESENH